MDNKQTQENLVIPQDQELSRFNTLIERFASIKEKYGDEYPIVLFEPSLKCQEKKALKEFLELKRSIHFFFKFNEAFEFVQSLGISFILIVPSDFEEQHVHKNFERLRNTYGRQMFDFEEETLFKDIFHGISDDLIKSLKMKVYVFITMLDVMTEAVPKEDDEEEEVMVMCDLKEMAKEFRQESVVIWYDPDIKLETKEVFTKKFDIEERKKHLY